MLKGKQSYAGFVLIYCYQCPLINIGREQVNSANHYIANYVMSKNAGSHLYDARFFAVGNGKDETKIKIICQNGKVIVSGVCNDFGITGIRRSNT